MTRVRDTSMTSAEMKAVREAANLSETQDEIFTDLCRGDLYNYAICQRRAIDARAFYRQKKLIEEKCARVLPALGMDYLLSQK